MPSKKTTSDPSRRFWQAYWGVICVITAVVVLIATFSNITFGGINTIALVASILLIGLTIHSLCKLNWFGTFLSLAGVVTILNATSDLMNLNLQAIGAIWVVTLLLSIGLSALVKNSQIP